MYKLSDLELPTALDDQSDLSSETDSGRASPPIDPHALDHLMAMCQSLSDATCEATAAPAPQLPEAAGTVAANAAEFLDSPMAKSGHAGKHGSDASGVGTSARGSDVEAGEAGADGNKGKDPFAAEVVKEDNAGGVDKGGC